MAAKLSYVSKEECAAQLGKSVRTIQLWSREKGFPAAARKGASLWCPDLIREWINNTGRNEYVTNTVGSGKGGNRSVEALLKLELLEGRARSQTAKSVMDVAEAGKELGLLLPRIAYESSLSTLMGGIRDLCEDLPERVHQIEGLDDTQRENVKTFLVSILETWQNRTADRIESVLRDLGPVPELSDLATMSRDTASQAEG